MTAPKDPDLSVAEVIAAIYYDPITGLITRPPGKRGGTGRLKGKGYLSLQIAGRCVRVHRLAWFYCYGRWPVGQIDHKNGNPLDNRICNLREANASTNNMNKRPAKVSKHGYRGVEQHRDKYRAALGYQGRNIKGRVFSTPEEAHADYKRLASAYYGEFAPL